MTIVSFDSYDPTRISPRIAGYDLVRGQSGEPSAKIADEDDARLGAGDFGALIGRLPQELEIAALRVGWGRVQVKTARLSKNRFFRSKSGVDCLDAFWHYPY